MTDMYHFRILALVVLSAGAVVLCRFLPAVAVPDTGRIGTPGSYYLARDRTGTGTPAVIRIAAQGVSLDLSGHTVACPMDVAGSTAIAIRGGHDDVTIRNGRVSGCARGITVLGSDGARIVGVDFTGVRRLGLVGPGTGTGMVVRRSLFAEIGGNRRDGYAIGITNPGLDCVVEDNEFHNITRQDNVPADAIGEGVAVIVSSGSTGCVIRGNKIVNDRPGLHHEIGIWVGDGSSAVVEQNTFANFGRGLAAYDTAVIEVRDNQFVMSERRDGSYAIAGGPGRAVGNRIENFESAFVGDIERSGNVVRNAPHGP